MGNIVLFKKEVHALPEQLDKGCVYFVRNGEGFDLYVSDATGTVAHKLNTGKSGLTEEQLLADYLRGKESVQ